MSNFSSSSFKILQKKREQILRSAITKVPVKVRNSRAVVQTTKNGLTFNYESLPFKVCAFQMRRYGTEGR